MSQTVLKLPQNKVYNMKDYYKPQLKAKVPQGAIFSAKVEGCSITAYKSGKVLFQGPRHFEESGKWGSSSGGSSAGATKKKPAPSSSPYAPPQSLYKSSHVGSDEAGTGDYFGPITVACAYVKEEQIDELKQIGVRDSKDLNDTQIQQIAQKVVKMGIPYSLVTLNNEKYNEWQQKGWSQGKMKTMLHHTAYNKLLKKIEPTKPEGWIIDQFAEPNVYKKHLRTENQTLQENVYFLQKAESYSIAVAAASIIARTQFVMQMDKLSEKAGMELPKGASKKVDQTAARLMEKEGKDSIGQYAKVHFATTEKALNYMKR